MNHRYWRYSFIGAFVGIIALGSLAASAEAAALSTGQINAVLSLLRAFNVNATTIASVQADLTGATTTTNGGWTYASSTQNAPPQPNGNSQSAACFGLSHNFVFGASDSTTGGDVSRLQQFLAAHTNYSAGITGFFGSLTEAALKNWQAENNIATSSVGGWGYVGPKTRAFMGTHCGGSPWPPPHPGSGHATSTVAVPTLYSINPSAGTVGSTTIALTGYGLTSNNIVLFNGLVAAHNVPITSSRAITCTTDPSCRGGINQTITFTVPSSLSLYCAPGMMCAQFVELVRPGAYQVTVRNENGVSNTLAFTVATSSLNTLTTSATASSTAQ